MSEFIFDDFITEIDSLEVKAPGAAFEKLPAGEHNVEIQKAQLKEYDDDVKIGLLIASVGGDYNGASCWVNLNIKKPSSPVAERIGREQFKKVMLACGFDTIKDVEDLVGGTFGVTLDYYQDKWAQLKRIHKSVPSPTTRSQVATSTAPPVESSSPFDRF